VLSLAEADQLSETSRAQPLPIVSRLTPEKLESGLASEIAAKDLRRLTGIKGNAKLCS
jgi:hypothetical protein